MNYEKKCNELSDYRSLYQTFALKFALKTIYTLSHLLNILIDYKQIGSDR